MELGTRGNSPWLQAPRPDTGCHGCPRASLPAPVPSCPSCPSVPWVPWEWPWWPLRLGSSAAWRAGLPWLGAKKLDTTPGWPMGAHGGPKKNEKMAIHHFNTQNSFVWGILRQVSTPPRLRVALHQGNREIEILLCNLSKCWAS